MRLPRLIVFAVAVLPALSCSDGTAPPERVTARFILESVNGQPLPATFSNGGWTFTIYSETIDLDAAGTATVAENRLETFGTYRNAGMPRLQVPYEIEGDRIIIGMPCGGGPLGDCAPRRAGSITPSSLTLTPYRNNEGSVSYSYRLSPGN